ncbi:MAG: Crp/Fnr family transcriptional regulator [Xanthomonadales bacterium]|nr:Crp/Fnr family transcriptional regulator [Xanthomonadales bacterium]
MKRSFGKKEVVISQGGGGRELFFVVSGHLRVSALSDEGKEISFGVLCPNDFFGELSLLDGRRRSATITTIENCELQMLSHPQYKRLLQDYPHSATQLLTCLAVALAERLRITDGLYLDTVFLDVPARLAKFLLKLSSPTTGSSPGERLLDIVLSQYEMGTLINASRESVNKQLRDWELSGVIEMNRGRTIILDSGFLQQKSMGQEMEL